MKTLVVQTGAAGPVVKRRAATPKNLRFGNRIRRPFPARMREADATMAASAALVTNARSRVNTRSEQLTAVTKTLGRLAQKQKLQDQVKFVVDFFKEVDTSMDEVRAAAESASEEAAAVAAVVATEAGEKNP